MNYERALGRLTLVLESLIRSLVAVGAEFEGFNELPTQIDAKLDRNLVPGVHIPRGQFELSFAAREPSADRDARVRDAVLASWKLNQFVALLANDAVVGGNIEECCDDKFGFTAVDSSVHDDLFVVAQKTTLVATGQRVKHFFLEIDLIDDSKDAIVTLDAQTCETAVLEDKDVVARVGDDGSLVLGDLNDGQASMTDDGRVERRDALPGTCDPVGPRKAGVSTYLKVSRVVRVSEGYAPGEMMTLGKPP